MTCRACSLLGTSGLHRRFGGSDDRRRAPRALRQARSRSHALHHLPRARAATLQRLRADRVPRTRVPARDPQTSSRKPDQAQRVLFGARRIATSAITRHPHRPIALTHQPVLEVRAVHAHDPADLEDRQRISATAGHVAAPALRAAQRSSNSTSGLHEIRHGHLLRELPQCARAHAEVRPTGQPQVIPWKWVQIAVLGLTTPIVNYRRQQLTQLSLRILRTSLVLPQGRPVTGTGSGSRHVANTCSMNDGSKRAAGVHQFWSPAFWSSARAGPPRAPETFPLDRVKRGQTGYGMTTFAGDTPERFTFEVISVVHNFLPKMDIILVKSDDPGRCRSPGSGRACRAARSTSMTSSPVRSRTDFRFNKDRDQRLHADRLHEEGGPAARSAARRPRGRHRARWPEKSSSPPPRR